MDARCRLCAEVYEELIEILEEADLSSKIYKLFQVDIASNDRLPKTICQKCYETIHATWNFNEQVQNAQVLLAQEYIVKPPLVQSPIPNENNIVKTETVFMLSDFNEEEESVKNKLLRKMNDTDSDYDCPPEILETASSAMLDLLPQKSRQIYLNQYEAFKEWCQDHKIKKLSENVLLAFFAEKAKQYKSSTLWSVYSMIKSTVMLKDNINISRYARLIAFLKKQNVGYKAKKSSVFTRDEINKFLLEASDQKYLMWKVCLIIGLAGACRRDELRTLKTSDIQDKENLLVITIPKTNNDKERIFTVTDAMIEDRSVLELYRKYAALRPDHIQHSTFFINYRDGKCSTQVIGVHTFGKIPSLIAQYLNLPNPSNYTGHSFRRTSASLSLESGANLSKLKRHRGWKSYTVAEGDLQDSLANTGSSATSTITRTSTANNSNEHKNDEEYHLTSSI